MAQKVDSEITTENFLELASAVEAGRAVQFFENKEIGDKVGVKSKG